MTITPLSRFVPVLALLCAGAFSRASEATRAGLIERTPFARQPAGSPAGFSGGAYELRGFFGPEGECEVSIRKSDTGRSEWVRVGEPGGKLFVESADAEAGTAVLVVDGRRLNLRLATADSTPVSATSGLDLSRHKRTGPEDYANVPNGQETPYTKARDAGLARLKAEHPEYFTNINSLTEDQRRAAANAINEVGRLAEAEVAAAPRS